MDARTRRMMQEMVSQMAGWVKSLAEDSQQLDDAGSAQQLERRVREEGRQMLGSLFEKLIQNALDHQEPARTCPRCGGRRRHKGRRRRGLLSSVGAIGVWGPYWYCPSCGGDHALESLADGSVSGVMREMLCLLGTALASFTKASAASEKLLGVRVSEAFIRRLCESEGRKVVIQPAKVEPGQRVTGSCDGTMVHTTQQGWKELKAYQFCYGQHKHGRAYWETSEQFTPRLRQAAVTMQAGRSPEFFWVSDAAEWIDKGVRVQLPSAIRIIDIWHAWQHVHEAAREVYPNDEGKALAWARRYCGDLEDEGGKALWRRLRHAKYQDPKRQEAVERLRAYLLRHADRLDYPTYKAHGWPISSGPMESFCKQLGQRLKGPGMRWSLPNLDPMAALVSLWANDEWDTHWQTAA
jgi:hypothetical protein